MAKLLIIEDDVAAASTLKRGLEEAGYAVNRWKQRHMYFGGVHAVGRAVGDALVAVGDPRRGGAAVIIGESRRG